MDEKIDFVITWVDGSDEAWLKQKKQYMPQDFLQGNGKNRYRDMECLKYWFRAVEKYTPWVNRIFFITWGHVPEWLNINNKKLKIVKHEDYIPKKYLPTFNSNAIELNMYRIDGLSEHFVNFNDDMFIIDCMKPSDFFYNGLPREYAILNAIIPTSQFEHIVLNNIIEINKNFNSREVIKKYRKKFFNKKYGIDNIRTIFFKSWPKVPGFKESHLPHAFCKSSFKEVWEKAYEVMDRTSSNKFRTNNDINQWLVEYWQIMSGKFEPQSVKIGKRFELNTNNDVLKEAIVKRKYKMICINDNDLEFDFDIAKEEIIKCFESVFPAKSSFEK